MRQLKYNTEKYPFKELVSSILLIDCPLDQIHVSVSDHDQVITREKDQHTIFHKLFYANNHKFIQLYKEFIQQEVRPLFKDKIVFQTIPTFRVQYPNNKGVGEFHKDGDYNHNKEEINFFLPFTDAHNTSTIWIESEPDKADYNPMNTPYGSVSIFNGVSLTHGNKINETGKTRVSVDFRIIPISKYKEEDGKSSINTNLGFKIGEYYSVTEY